MDCTTGEPKLKKPGLPRAFWMLALASSLSKMGNQFLYIAVPWAIIKATGSAKLATFSLAAQGAPYILAPLLGVIIDSYNRKRVYVVCQVLQSLLVACLPSIVGLPTEGSLALAYVVLAIIGLCGVVENLVSDYVLVPQMVSQSDLARANGTYYTLAQVARLAGPAVAGVLISKIGSDGALWIDAITFCAPVAVVIRLKWRQVQGADPKSARALLVGGWTVVLRTRVLGLLSVTLLVLNLGVGGLSTFLVSLSAGEWQLGSHLVGSYLTIAGCCLAVGSLSARRVASASGHEAAVGRWLLVCASGTVPFLTREPAWTFLGFAVVSLGLGGLNVTTITLRQRLIGSSVVGTANAVIRMIVMGAIPVSAIMLAQLNQSLGLKYAAWLPVLAGWSALLLWRHAVSRVMRGVSPDVPRQVA